MRASIIATVVVLTQLTSTGCAVMHHQQTAPAAQINDRVIASTIKTRHAERQDLSLTCITVESLYGVVLLSGFVKKTQEKMTAEEIARQVDGVKSVHNEILIRADETPMTCRATPSV